MTDTSQTRLSYIAETTYGVTPATPVFKNVRFTSENFKPAIQYVSSNEIRADRNVSDMTRVGAEASGEVGFELSYGSFDDFLEGLMFNTWSTNILKNGTTQKSFTFEKTFESGVTDNYHRYPGGVVNSMSLSMRSREIVTGSFGVMAKGVTSAPAIITGATYTAVNANPVMNAANNFASLAITGVASPSITGLSLNITNNLAQQPVLGSINSKGIRSGRFMVTGEIEAYFDTAELFELYLNDTASDLTFALGGASSLKYLFNVPKLKFTDSDVVAGGNDADVMARMSFQAYYDATNAASLKITRTP